jgi:hypothetical protein
MMNFIIAVTSDGLMTSLRTFIGPILLFALSVMSISFLVKRQFMAMLTFAICAFVTFVLFWHPEILGNLGESFGKSNADLTWN